jgi:hypothetical protein
MHLIRVNLWYSVTANDICATSGSVRLDTYGSKLNVEGKRKLYMPVR